MMARTAGLGFGPTRAGRCRRASHGLVHWRSRAVMGRYALQPEEGVSFWRAQPTNGYVTVKTSPSFGDLQR